MAEKNIEKLAEAKSGVLRFSQDVEPRLNMAWKTEERQLPILGEFSSEFELVTGLGEVQFRV